jgi:hypothetical protein
MLSFAKRRLINGTITAVLIALVCYWVHRRSAELEGSTFQTGYLLLALVGFLVSYNWRKKLPSLPLGSSSLWLQAHIYCGIGAIAVFLLHTGVRFPNGILEITLYFLFVSVAASGLYGLKVTRSVPKRLTKLREQVLWERIPVLRIAVGRQAHGLILELVEIEPAPTIVDFYKHRLLPFFQRRRSPWYYAYPTSRLRNKIMAEMSALGRYYSTSEDAADSRLRRLVDQRDDLDYHDALQRKLKVWLFVHIGLTYALVALALFHAVMAHAFHGAAS